VFDWLTQLQASPLTYLAVLGACALDAVLPIVPSDAVVIAASVLAVRGELWIWLVAVAAAAGGFWGDMGSYVLGRTAGATAARRLFRSPKAKGRLTWAGEALDRHGATIIVVAALSLAAGRRRPSPPEPCGCPGRALPLPTRLARPYGRRMRQG
jgi:membrane protein DedA with SNARE-associated domain